MSDLTVKLSDKLQRAQNYCIRFIFGIRKRGHVSPFFLLRKVRWYHILFTLQTILRTKSPPYISEKCLFLSEIMSEIYIVHVCYQIQYTLLPSIILFYCCGMSSWNNLRDNLRSIDGCARFRAEVKENLRRG